MKYLSKRESSSRISRAMERDSIFNKEKQKEKEKSITGLGRWLDSFKGKGACSTGLKT